MSNTAEARPDRAEEEPEGIESIGNLSMVAYALEYATALHFPVFPLWGIDEEGRCRCGGRKSCEGGRNAGKHPIHSGGHLQATTDVDVIRAWWEEHPDANIGLYCAAAGIVVVDRDPRNGSDVTWARLEEEHGALESDVAAITGGGGRHEFFGTPNGNWQPIGKKLRPGVDLKYNGYVVLAPSLHKSGNTYCWAPDSDPFSQNFNLLGLNPLPSCFIKQGPADRGAARTRAPSEGADARERLNREALNHIDRWAPHAYPDGNWSSGGSWRVESADLCRAYEEALVIHPDGIQDFGPECGLTPVWLLRRDFHLVDGELEWNEVEDWEEESRSPKGMSEDEAAVWLAERLGRDWVQMKLDDAERVFADEGDTGANKDAASSRRGGASGAGGGSAQPDQPDMTILRRHRLPAPELPLDVFGPFWAHRIVSWAKGASAPADFVAASLLAGAAMLIGNSRWVSPRHDWAEPPVLWVMLIGPPSANKSPAMNFLLQILRDVEREMARDFAERLREWEIADKAADLHRAEWQKQVATAIRNDQPQPPLPREAVAPEKPTYPRILVVDTTVEALLAIASTNPKGVLHVRDELAGWYGSLDRYSNGGDRPFWLECYGGRYYAADRVKNGGTPIKVDRLSVGLLGGIQPDRLADILNSPADGLQARFLPIWPDSVKREWHWSDIEDDGGAHSALARLSRLALEQTSEGAPTPIYRRLSQGALAEFVAWWEAQGSEGGGVDGPLAEGFGKAPGLVLRLSLILEYLWWCVSCDDEPTEVGVDAVRAAIRLRDSYIKPMMERTYEHASLPEADRLAMTLAQHIAANRPEVVNTRMLQRKVRLPGLTCAEKIKVATEQLVLAGWLLTPRPVGKAGRPKGEFIVNPAVWQALDGA